MTIKPLIVLQIAGCQRFLFIVVPDLSHQKACRRKIGQFVGPNSSLIAKLFKTFNDSILYCHAASPLIKLYRDVRAHVYALAYKSEMFYTFDSTQSRNESGSERFKNKKGIFHSNNERTKLRYSDIAFIFRLCGLLMDALSS